MGERHERYLCTKRPNINIQVNNCLALGLYNDSFLGGFLCEVTELETKKRFAEGNTYHRLSQSALD